MATELGSVGPRDPLRAIYEREQSRPQRRRYYGAVAGAVVLVAFVSVIYYAYHEGIRQGSESVAPLIRADQQPFKVKPENPGGMEIPNQDKLIYNEISPDGEVTKPDAERLLPPAEQPMARPTSDQANAAPAAQMPMPAVTIPSVGTAPRPAGTPAYVPLAPMPAPPVDHPGSAAPALPAVAPAQLAAAPATAGPVFANKWRVQLGAFRSNDDAQHQWARMRKDHPDLLGSLTLSVERIDLGPNRGIYFRMQAGPLPDRDVATALCARLKADHVGCMTVKP
jgi:cell division septation protein DedD